MNGQSCQAHREVDIGVVRERRIEALFTFRAAPALVVLALLAVQLVLITAGA